MLELRSRGFYVQANADDPAVLVTGVDMLWIRGMAQKAINIAVNWASEQELQFGSKKTEIVLFTHKRNPDLGFKSMSGSKLELSKEARLLGVTLDSKLAWKPQIVRITPKTTTALMQCRKIVSKTWGIKPSMMKWISEVESSRTSLASRTSSRTHYEVLGLGLEASSPRKLACPRLEDSSIF